MLGPGDSPMHVGARGPPEPSAGDGAGRDAAGPCGAKTGNPQSTQLICMITNFI